MHVQFEWQNRTPPGADEAPRYRVTLKTFTRLDRGKRGALLREGRAWFADHTGRDAGEDFTDLTEGENDLLQAVSERALMLAALEGVEVQSGDEWQPCAPFWADSVDAFLALDASLWDTWFVLAVEANSHLFAPADNGSEEAKKNLTKPGVSGIIYST